jgi:hypothetical protein
LSETIKLLPFDPEPNLISRIWQRLTRFGAIRTRPIHDFAASLVNILISKTPFCLFIVKNLSDPRPVDAEYPTNLAVTHPAFAHSENISV